MSDIRPVKKDPYGKIAIPPIEEKEKESYTKEKSKKKSSLNLLFIIKKILSYLLQSHKKNVDCQELEKALFIIKGCLKKIAQENVGGDLAFFKEFSFYCKKIAQLSQSAHISSKQKRLLKNFLEKLQNYPPHVEFSLLYYLEKIDEQSQIPYAYTQIIQDLHKEAMRNIQENILQHWIFSLNTLIRSL